MKIEKINIRGKLEKCSQINLILGANNTGKTTFIRELESCIKTDPINNSWIKGLVIEVSGIKTKFERLFPGILDIENFIDADRELRQTYGDSVFFPAGNFNSQAFNLIKEKGDNILRHETSPVKNSEWYYFNFLANLYFAIENCSTRLSGPFSSNVEIIDQPYRDIVHYFYSNTDIFKKISIHIKEVFDVDILFDNLSQGQKNIRFKPNVPIPSKFNNNRDGASFWRKHSAILDSQGDGIKAYLKIIYSLFHPAKEIIIIDEPEAFLHPPQRRSLGKFIAQNASNGKQIFISTHDSEFLRGVLTNATQDVQIIHLKNKNGVRCYKINEINLLDKSKKNNELILNSYFNKITILCEAEDDRVVYQYASQFFFPSKAVEAHFIGLNGKPEVFYFFKFFKKIEIDVAVIVDIDVLYSGECLKLELDFEERKIILETKKMLNELTEEEKLSFKKDGINSLSNNSIIENVKKSITIAKKYKVNILKIGELESILDKPTSNSRTVQMIKNEIDASRLTDKKIALKELLGDIVN